MDTATDEILIEKTLARSQDAFDILMRRYERLVYKVAHSYGRSQENALDITQNVFLKAYARLESFNGRGSFQAWLMRIAYHEGVNWARGQQRYGQQESLAEEDEFEARDDQEIDLLDRERRGLVLKAMDKLNPRGRLAISLRYFQNLSIRDVAALLECSEGVAKSILFRSIRKMRDALA